MMTHFQRGRVPMKLGSHQRQEVERRNHIPPSSKRTYPSTGPAFRIASISSWSLMDAQPRELPAHAACLAFNGSSSISPRGVSSLLVPLLCDVKRRLRCPRGGRSGSDRALASLSEALPWQRVSIRRALRQEGFGISNYDLQ